MKEAIEKMKQIKGVYWQEAVDLYVEEAIRITHSTIGYFAILSWAEDELTMLGWSKTAMAECMEIKKPILYKLEETGLWGDCIRNKAVVITNDYEHSTSPNKKGYPERHVKVIRHMNVPVHQGTKMRGILGVGNKEDLYTDEDAKKLQQFADETWKYLNDILAV